MGHLSRVPGARRRGTDILANLRMSLEDSISLCPENVLALRASMGQRGYLMIQLF